MQRRLLTGVGLALVACLVALASTATAAPTQVSGKLTVLGPWRGANEQSFRAVLDGFRQQQPGVQVTYVASEGDVATAIPASQADVAVLSLPDDLEAMRSMARAGTLRPTEFAVPAVRANYAFAWKQLGSVDGKLFGVFVKATNDSAFWFNLREFQSRGIATTPTTWKGLKRLSDALAATGAKPFAVSGESGFLLPSLFENVYLMQQGNQRYDRLARGEIRWTDGSVRDAMATMRNVLLAPGRVAGTLGASLETTFPGAVQKVFGSPQVASLVQGGSAVIPILTNAKAVRPIAQFGVIPFPSLNGIGPGRVIGRADATVMVRDSAAARALISYLATPAAATIWAKRGGDYLSPNRGVDLAAYGVPVMRTLASALTRASVFRLGLAEMLTPAVRAELNRTLTQFARHPEQVAQLTARLDAAVRAA
jgi:ABC-type glycerol-3-phosphate transport system substrate-binding protein